MFATMRHSEPVMFRRLRRANAALPSAQASLDAYRHQYVAFLDQARWIYEQHQRRNASFQQMAVALLGFDGVLLAVLVSAGTRPPVPTAYAAALLVLGATFAVLVIYPWRTYFIDTEGTIEAWEKFHSGDLSDEAQLFAQMLLARQSDLVDEQQPTRRGAKRRYERAAKKRQPLVSIETLGSVRASLLTASCLMMLGAFSMFAWSLFAPVQ